MEERSMQRIQKIIQANIEISKRRSQEKSQNLNSDMQSVNSFSPYKCTKCSDTGWILKNQEHGQPIAYPCECRKIKKSSDNFKLSGLNPEMNDFTFSNFKVWNDASRNAKDTAIIYYSDFKNIKKSRVNSIIFCGQVGSGKTHLSVALALNFIKNNISVVYMPYRDVITKLKQNMFDNEYYKKTISKFQKCEVLLIDDLYKGKVTESDINIMFEILNYRYLNFLPIIVSSEFTIENLLTVDEAVGSRIYEMCKNYIVENSKNIKNNYRLR